MIPLSVEADIVFWICGPLVIAGALGLVLFRKAVYSALSMAFAMVNLAALYAAMEAPLLAAAQVIVYTGAIMMLFLFVLMLVGVDQADSLVETIKGQRIWAGIGVLGVIGLIIAGIGHAVIPVEGLEAANNLYGGNVQSLAALIFGRYVFGFELTSALLITAAVGAMVLAQHARLVPKISQRERAQLRMDAYAEQGVHPGALPSSGVYALNNSIAAPALLPDGSVSPESVSEVLDGRGATLDAPAMSSATAQAFAAVDAATKGELE
ncbi:MAG: NADH-quinone oxidoreductase subunit J [Propionibacteriaceae bacterium]|jgi:NADH-quinone oxidoreductase subunit J|nr:NADH-quinone oxidoreductase subunit J [Propionibacteriaceae bacterium]